ncbi:YidH family protein [Nocardia australiensis]|uniref:YidH family protein n=1 Tax=Nocardia australiensis TaxID=2887191 RepID=UPI001D14406A|nr:DUF202 domain-containing protein [Nocardia australiensis]
MTSDEPGLEPCNRPVDIGSEGSSPIADDHEAADPIDYRFTLANERTFLAWVRTALGLLAGAVAVHALIEPVGGAVALRAAVFVCVALAFILSIVSYRRWRAVERAMNAGTVLPGPGLAPILAGGMAVVSVLAAAAVLMT